MFTDIYDIKTDNQFCNTLEDYIRERGAISELISRSTKVETSKRVLDITRGQINCTYGSPIIEYVISITVNQAKRVWISYNINNTEDEHKHPTQDNNTEDIMIYLTISYFESSWSETISYFNSLSHLTVLLDILYCFILLKILKKQKRCLLWFFMYFHRDIWMFD